MSEVLKAFIARYWKEANRPSWMTVAEMKDCYNKKDSEQFAHFDFQSMEKKYHKPDTEIRAVFWEDQCTAQGEGQASVRLLWIPACAGMTDCKMRVSE